MNAKAAQMDGFNARNKTGAMSHAKGCVSPGFATCLLVVLMVEKRDQSRESKEIFQGEERKEKTGVDWC